MGGFVPRTPSPLAGGTCLYAGIGCSVGEGEMPGACCSAKQQKAVENQYKLLGKNRRKVAAAGETASGGKDDSVIVVFTKAVRLTTGTYSKVTHHRIRFCLNFR